ncbi:urease accessory protein UreD [Gordonia jinhuaensis]|uniref:Urease accessory protein n=1 Tax=Gordonia jinhuaensis TaxID=1517702 RepID=A0A916T6S3_9ACTN|nr:urease accessory protein UreD [Gordonia jinhuaensis]GGB32933.1 urease accessory protein [Gordonia jinhuaensis]
MFTEVTITATPGRSPRITAVGGLTARLTGPDRVHLISTAATPLGDDQIVVRIEVASGARLELTTTAATVIYPGRGDQTSTATWDLTVGEDGSLVVCPLPTILVPRSRHRSVVRADLDDTSRLLVTESVQRGRSNETAGSWSGTMSVDVAGRPVLRHRIDLPGMATSIGRWPAPRALVSAFRYPAQADEAAVSPVVAAGRMPLAGGGELITATGADVVSAQAAADDLLLDARWPAGGLVSI